MLERVGIPYRVNTRLVRGLDYYSKTVFEWVTEKLGAQGTVCAGGRFDGLVEQLGGKSTTAAGFALGMERLVALLDDKPFDATAHQPHAYLLLAGKDAELHGLQLAEQLRDALPGLRLMLHCGGGSFKSQMKKADKSGARYALILGEDEMANEQVTVKDLRGDAPQQQIGIRELADYLAGRLALPQDES
jgi:histidyl-tRNA synthetase